MCIRDRSWGVLVLYAAQRLGLDERGFGVLAMVTAIGGVLGTLSYPWLTERVSFCLLYTSRCV